MYDSLEQMRARTVVEDDLLQGDNQAAGIAGGADFAKGIDPGLDIACPHPIPDEGADLLMGRGTVSSISVLSSS